MSLSTPYREQDNIFRFWSKRSTRDKPSNAVANVQVFVFGVENIGGRKYAVKYSSKEHSLSAGSNLVAMKSIREVREAACSESKPKTEGQVNGSIVRLASDLGVSNRQHRVMWWYKETSVLLWRSWRILWTVWRVLRARRRLIPSLRTSGRSMVYRARRRVRWTGRRSGAGRAVGWRGGGVAR